MYFYHLRRVGAEGIKLGGLTSEYRALCGSALGWDTRTPLSTWGFQSHLRERYCEECASKARSEQHRLGPR